jgi:3-methyl-2-oxobutanoate hydroxymethyltransferase
MARITAPELRLTKGARRLVCLTAYDAPTAHLADQAGVDILLVGDSVAMTVLGMATTLEVTMEDMIHHCRAVVRGSERAHIVLDLPFMSYQSGEDDAVRSAGRAIKEGGAQSVKLEGGVRIAPLVARLVDIGIPVMGHIGLQPQSINQVGGFRLQGATAAAADALIADAAALAEAGVYAMVMEKIPSELAAHITARSPVPTIGIGSGPDCDGQVLVVHDMLGWDTRFHPKHSKLYASIAPVVRDAMAAFADDVRNARFPGPEQSVSASEELRAHLRDLAS